MTPTVTVLAPVLDRPQHVGRLAQSLADSVRDEDAEVALLFLCSPGDDKEIAEIQKRHLWHMIVPLHPGFGEYGQKINYGATNTTSDWLLTGADDIIFHAGWLREALNVHIATGALVIGTNDLVNSAVKAGRHATHSLVHRDYIAQGTIDAPGLLLHPAYQHNAVDVEFTETAQARGTWAFAEKSHVEHKHPVFDRTVKRDATYNKGIRHATRDKQLCNMRRHLWNPNAPAAPSPPIRGRHLMQSKRRPPKSHWPAR